MAPNPISAVIGPAACRPQRDRADDQSPLARFLARFAGRVGSRAALVGLILLIWEFAPVCTRHTLLDEQSL